MSWLPDQGQVIADHCLLSETLYFFLILYFEKIFTFNYF